MKPELFVFVACLVAKQNDAMSVTCRLYVFLLSLSLTLSCCRCLLCLQEFFAEQPKTTPSFATRTTVDLTPPVSGSYLLNFDVGLAPVNTTFAFDDIMICEQSKQLNTAPNSNANSNNLKGQDPAGVLRTDTSTGFEKDAPLLFRAQVTPPAEASVNMQLQSSAAASTGASGAAVTVNTPSDQPWHVQLAGPAVPLDASKSYTVQISLRQFGSSNSNKGNVLQVNWVQPEVWIPTALSSIQPTASYTTYTLPAMSPPSSGLFYLTVDMGSVAAGTTLYFDDIRVFEA